MTLSNADSAIQNWGSILYKARIVDVERYWDAEFEIRENILISESVTGI